MISSVPPNITGPTVSKDIAQEPDADVIERLRACAACLRIMQSTVCVNDYIITARDTTVLLGVFDVSSSIVLTGAVLYSVSSSWKSTGDS